MESQRDKASKEILLKNTQAISMMAKKHGVGKETMFDGSEYEGEFENGERHGEGTFKASNLEYVFTGSFKHG